MKKINARDLAEIVLLSTADWDNPFWTNKQHVAAGLARAGHRVLYIESLGLRKPSATARDIKRILRRALRAIRFPRQVRENIWVWSPLVLPWQSNGVVRWLNRVVLNFGLILIWRWLRFRDPVLWTYNPMALRFINPRQFALRIYHCVDEIKAQPGMPVQALEAAESALVASSDIVFTTSPELAASRSQWNKNTHYLPNVADYDHFAKAMDSSTVVPEDMMAIKGPRIGFIGAISGYKVDFDLLRGIALARPDWSLVLIGEVGEGDPWTDSTLLRGLPNVHLLGPRPYESLPAYLKGIDVALLPNRLNDYTRSMFPMKFFEYLAAGRAIVSVELEALREFEGVVRIAAPVPEAFVSAISDVLAGVVPSLSDRLALARAHTYETRLARMWELIGSVNGGARV